MKNYKCPPFPEKCKTAMSCRLEDPLTGCPYNVKGKRNDCCVSMGHIPPPIPYGAVGHGKWMYARATPETVPKRQ